MKLLLYNTSDMEGRPFHVINNVSFNVPYTISGMASNTDYYVVLLDDFNDVVDLSNNPSTSFKTRDIPRGLGYHIKIKPSGNYPVTLYDQNGDEVIPDYYYIFLNRHGNFEALANSQIEPYGLTPDYIVKTSTDNSFPTINEPYCVVAINNSSYAISEVITP